MVLAPPLRIAVTGAALLLSLFAGGAESTSSLQFPDCVSTCIASSGCATDNTKCMCKASKGYFLEMVVTCMYYRDCKDNLRDVDGSFLDILVRGCKDIKKPVSKSNLDAAEKLASTLSSRLKTTQTTSPSTAVRATVKTTTTSASPTTTLSPSVSSQDSPASPTTTPELAPTSAVASSVPESSTATEGQSFPPVPTDSSPFATFPSVGSRSGVCWLILPLVVALVFR